MILLSSDDEDYASMEVQSKNPAGTAPCTQGFPRCTPRGITLRFLLQQMQRFTDFRRWGFECHSVTKGGAGVKTRKANMFLIIALLLLVMWAGGFLMFHVASGL